jgi:protein phosphatase
MELWGITDSGRVRHENQDVFKIFYDDEKDVAVLVLCDGMGGARAGNVASAIAAETFMHHMGKYIEDVGSIDDTAAKISNAVLAANKAVFEKSAREDEYAGMGTTLTAAILTPDGVVIANVGDSRAYHATMSRITQVTRDHSVVEDMIARGDITRAEARLHPSKHLITRALGTYSEEKPDVFTINPDNGDYILLCSDGLSNIVMDSEMLFEMQRGTGVCGICENLTELALSRGAPDNVTVVILKR